MIERARFSISPVADLPPSELNNFLNSHSPAFQNLDWLTPPELLSQPGFHALLMEGEIRAVLAATPENPTTAWMRFFYADSDYRRGHFFDVLMKSVVEALRLASVHSLYALAPYHWLERLLAGIGFEQVDQIITLQYRPSGSCFKYEKERVIIREMNQRDLASVAKIDSAAFSAPWQLNLASLEKSYHLSAWHSVALLNGELVGYQISTNIFNSAHLARLAVSPEHQRQGVGRLLAEDMLDRFTGLEVSEISVNTQASNNVSISLYHSLGFARQEQDLPVFCLNL